MDLTELLRSQAKKYKCSACGTNMSDCDIKVLAQQGNRALVRVTCAACKDENLLQIIFQADGGDFTETDEPIRTPLFDEDRPAIDTPISADELVELHLMLRDFEASLTELVKPQP